MKMVYTLGTDLRSLEDFIEILSGYGIEAVIDVRSFPTSKLEHFKRVNLEFILKKELFEYHHLGKRQSLAISCNYLIFSDTTVRLK